MRKQSKSVERLEARNKNLQDQLNSNFEELRHQAHEICQLKLECKQSEEYCADVLTMVEALTSDAALRDRVERRHAV